MARIHKIDRFSDACKNCGATMDDIIGGLRPRRCSTEEGDNIYGMTHLRYRQLWIEEHGFLPQDAVENG